MNSKTCICQGKLETEWLQQKAKSYEGGCPTTVTRLLNWNFKLQVIWNLQGRPEGRLRWTYNKDLEGQMSIMGKAGLKL